jgi:indolepyruvate ferredoxin oxidoreductase beta subunit
VIRDKNSRITYHELPNDERMEIKIVIAGVGGQGVVYATKVLSQAGLLRGEKVMASENHGMSQRGGSVMSHLKFGSSDAPLIRRGTADSLVGFDRSETMRHLTFVRASGNVFVNSTNGLDPSLGERLKELNITVHAINAEACAKELGSPAATNLIVLGFAAAHSEFGLSLDDLKNSVRALGPAKAVELNLRALDLGASKK